MEKSDSDIPRVDLYRKTMGSNKQMTKITKTHENHPETIKIKMTNIFGHEILRRIQLNQPKSCRKQVKNRSPVRPCDRPSERPTVRPTDRPTVRPSDRPPVRPTVGGHGGRGGRGGRGAPVGLPSVRPTVRPSKNHSKTMKKHFSSIIDEVISSRNPILIFPEVIYIEKP